MGQWHCRARTDSPARHPRSPSLQTVTTERLARIASRRPKREGLLPHDRFGRDPRPLKRNRGADPRNSTSAPASPPSRRWSNSF